MKISQLQESEIFEPAEARTIRRTKLIDKRTYFGNKIPECKDHTTIDIRDLIGTFYFPGDI